jgi:transposase
MARIKVTLVRELLRQLDNEEISFSRMVELLNEKANEPEGFAAGSVACDLCSYQWVAVRPAELTTLECPNCGNMASFEEK